MSNPAWKAFERRVAKFFGSTRNPLSGANSKHTASDSLHPDFFIEAKLRQTFAHHTLYDQTKQLAAKEDKLPVIVTQRAKSPGFLIIVHSDDLLGFLKLFLKSKGYKLIKTRRNDAQTADGSKP